LILLKDYPHRFRIRTAKPCFHSFSPPSTSRPAQRFEGETTECSKASNTNQQYRQIPFPKLLTYRRRKKAVVKPMSYPLSGPPRTASQRFRNLPREIETLQWQPDLVVCRGRLFAHSIRYYEANHGFLFMR
jgi:hypothetical protein